MRNSEVAQLLKLFEINTSFFFHKIRSCIHFFSQNSTCGKYIYYSGTPDTPVIGYLIFHFREHHGIESQVEMLKRSYFFFFCYQFNVCKFRWFIKIIISTKKPTWQIIEKYLFLQK